MRKMLQVEKKALKRPSPQNIIIKEEQQDEDENESSSPINEPSPRKNLKYEELLKCDMCSTVCSSVSQLQQHTLSEHVPDRKPSPTKSSPCPPNQRVSCQQCDETFENFQQFAIHMKTHISSTSQLFHCPVCPISIGFPDKKSQLEHMTTQHIQMQLTQYVCNECDTILSTPSSLSTHFVEVHRKYICSSCEFVTDNEKSFRDHSKMHSRQIIMFGCSLCGNAYATQARLINHVLVSHDQETMFPPAHFASKPTTPSPKLQKPRLLQCSVCDETVLGEDGLDDHRLKEHCKVRYADKCADCQEPLETEESFVSHCLRHARDHSHHCPICRQSLRSDSQIHAHCKYHMQRPETEEEEVKKEDGIENFNFVCPICGEKMENGFELMEHSKQKHE